MTPKGDFRNPVTQEELEAKFTNLARREIADGERIARIIAFVRDLEQAPDIGALFALLQTSDV
jgi:2-methylcitrate dehydratase PrpD